MKVGLLACAFHEYWRMFSEEFRSRVIRDIEQAAAGLRRQHLEVVNPCLVDTLETADAAGRTLAAAGIGMLVLVEATYVPDDIPLQALRHLAHVPVAVFSTQEQEDISPADDYEALMRNGGLTGTTQLTATFTKMGRAYDVVAGSLAEERPFQEIARTARVRDVVASLRGLHIGMLGHVFPGMYDLEMDRTRMCGTLGPNVVSVDLEQFVQQWREISEDETRTAAEALVARFRIEGPGEQDLRGSIRVGIAMERLLECLGLDALCFLGQDYVERAAGAPARLGGSLMLEKGRLVSCEGDLAGLVMMHMLYWLAGNPPLQAEWAQYDAAHNALLLVGHGIGSPAMAGSDDRVTLTASPEAWGTEGAGVNLQFILKPGRVTMGGLLETPLGWRMVISSGECLDYPCLPCREIHALVRVDRPVKQYVADIQRRGVSHHVFVAYGDVRAELELLASTLGIRPYTV